jgi:benzoyl-CoA reductase/2-hydroxyglutaryl-CoA dehydratase subunit BcrC/BadD/HgdB
MCEHRVKYVSDQLMDAICGHWKVDGVILHYNRDCEGISVGIVQNHLNLLQMAGEG